MTAQAKHRAKSKALHNWVVWLTIIAGNCFISGFLNVSPAQSATSDASRIGVWTTIAEAGSEAALTADASVPPNSTETNSLRLTVKKSRGRAGVFTAGPKRMKLASGDWYDLTFYARTETNRHFGLVVSLESRDGKSVCARATIPEVGGAWKKYVLALQTRRSNSRARLVIGMPESGTVWLAGVSLISRGSSKDILHP